ncbi:MAG: hypothetical protein WC426_02480 [Sulfuriferula sp.]
MQYTANPQSQNNSGVSVLYAYPPTATFKSLGLIDFDYYQPGFREPTVTDALPKLKEKVSEVGGNALIVRNQRMNRYNARYITISAEVLRIDWSK